MSTLENIFTIKRGDTLPALQISVYRTGRLSERLPLNLSAVTACTFSMRSECGDQIINSQPATIVCTSDGTLQYSWQPGDTNIEGMFNGEFELSFSGYNSTTIMSLPPMGYIRVEILKDLHG